MYGAIERIRIVKDRKGKSRSYAFIVYERERDMKGESFVETILTHQPHTKTQKGSQFIINVS
jgi:hypothetical protein